MLSSEDDGTDGASIKPVSSLRSHFEKIASSQSVLCAAQTRPAFKSVSTPGGGIDANQTIARASLDIPRVTSPWLTPDIIVPPQRFGTPMTPSLRPRRTDTTSVQRPLSMSSLSFPPPKSPRPVGQLSDFQSPLKVPVPPRRPSSRSSTVNFEQGSVDVGIRGPSSKVIEVTQSYQHGKNTMPPPVNRAEKPKIPSKPRIASKTTLGVVDTSIDNRVFSSSTPPSRDESLRPEPSNPMPDRRHSVASNTAREILPPPLFKDQPQTDKKFGDVQGFRQKAPSVDSRRQGFSQETKKPTEDRPGLPPRRDQGRTVMSPKSKEPQADESRTAQSSLAQSLQSNALSEFLTPPRRASLAQNPAYRGSANGYHAATASQYTTSSSQPITGNFEEEPSLDPSIGHSADYPDATNTNRRPPYCSVQPKEIEIGYDARLIDLCGQHVCATGYLTRVWDLASQNLIVSHGHVEKETKEIKVTALAFKPGSRTDDEGSRLWLGTNYGDIQELDIATQSVVFAKSGPHEKREVLKIFRYQNTMWSLDDGGKLCVWSSDREGLPSLHSNPSSHRVPRGHTFSINIQDNLWLATGKEIRVFRPNAHDSTAFDVLQKPLCQASIGVVTSGAVIGGQVDRAYFGHSDGKVSIYSTLDFSCLGIVTVNIYKISSLAGAGSYLWAGFNTGMMYVYDTRTDPWITKKEWLAHYGHPVLDIFVDRGSLWRTGILRVASVGADNAIRFWDGTLESDWLDDNMQDHDVDYCSFREITAVVVSWNAGAATPSHLHHDKEDPHFFREVLQVVNPPDLLVFNFQELVDLEDKKLTAKTLLKGNKKKDPSEHEQMSRQYRAWRDYLVRCIEDSMPSDEPYHLLHTASMVGLFTCVFVKASLRQNIQSVNNAEIKRGMGGLHGNKGAIVFRLILNDSSLCLVNCHLAAGQTQTANRNNDITAILESSLLPPERDLWIRRCMYSGGGDGSKILDNEMCILNGDLNYRIDTMGRDTVVKAVNANNLPKLLERDQLLVSKRRNPTFRARALRECPITFAPTYKYDIGSDRYDTSEKRRAPAWCDRILYRGAGNIKQTDYRRHELRISDHRPVSGLFKMRIKKVSVDKRAQSWKECEERFGRVKEKLAREVKVEYLRDVLGVPPEEGRRLI